MTHNTGPSQNTQAQKSKLEEILTETPDDDEFDDQLGPARQLNLVGTTQVRPLLAT